MFKEEIYATGRIYVIDRHSVTISPAFCVQKNRRNLYEFNPDTKILDISMSPGDLELLLKEIGPIKSGEALTLSMSSLWWIEDTFNVQGVREIRSYATDKYLLQHPAHHSAPPVFLQKLMATSVGRKLLGKCTENIGYSLF